MSMTREEAIELLKYRRNIISNVDVDWNAKKSKQSTLLSPPSALSPGSR